LAICAGKSECCGSERKRWSAWKRLSAASRADGYKVFDRAGEEIGIVTTFPSPTLCKNIALAYVRRNLPRSERALRRGSLATSQAQVVPTPVYKRPKETCAEGG